MTSNLGKGWQRLRAAKPGERFQDRYRASRRSDGSGWWWRIMRIVLATVSIAIGVVLAFIPGPAILFFAIAGTLLASESLTVARLLDWSEVKIRRLAHWTLETWRRISPTMRLGAIAIVAAVAVVAFYLGYRLLFAD